MRKDCIGAQEIRWTFSNELGQWEIEKEDDRVEFCCLNPKLPAITECFCDAIRMSRPPLRALEAMNMDPKMDPMPSDCKALRNLRVSESSPQYLAAFLVVSSAFIP
jgi:hypothetical protein